MDSIRQSPFAPSAMNDQTDVAQHSRISILGHESLARSPTGVSRATPAAGATQGCHACRYLPVRCHYAGDNQMVVTKPSGHSRFTSQAASSAACVPSARALCSQENGDESTEHSQSGRQALAYTGRRSLATLAVCGCLTLLPARYVARAVLGRVGPAVGVHTTSPVVASVRLAVVAPHRLGAPLPPP